jgi:hypothetical protein
MPQVVESWWQWFASMLMEIRFNPVEDAGSYFSNSVGMSY